MSASLDTRDIGFLLRGLLEDHTDTPIDRMTDLPDEQLGVEVSEAFVTGVDISDPHNPKLHLSNGQAFTIRIIAGER